MKDKTSLALKVIFHVKKSKNENDKTFIKMTKNYKFFSPKLQCWLKKENFDSFACNFQNNSLTFINTFYISHSI